MGDLIDRMSSQGSDEQIISLQYAHNDQEDTELNMNRNIARLASTLSRKYSDDAINPQTPSIETPVNQTMIDPEPLI